MKFATYNNGTPDGRLVLVSRDLTMAIDAPALAPSLLYAVQHWEGVESALQRLPNSLNAGRLAGAFPSTQSSAWRLCRAPSSGAMLQPFSTTDD